MTTTIRTKWHRIMPLIEANKVYLTAPVDGTSPHWDNFNPDRELTKQFIRDMGQLPKFVIENELMEIANRENFQSSLLDMKKAGVLRLPFPAMTVEFDTYHGARVIVMLRDNAALELQPWEPPPMNDGTDDFRHKTPFYGLVMRIHKDEDGEYLVMSPDLSGINMDEVNGVPHLHLSGVYHGMITREGKELHELVSQTYVKDSAWLWRAFMASMLLMHTHGVAKEVIECSRINKKRLNTKKQAIPTHTYLHIGRVYKSAASNDSDEYTARKSPLPHWRRGHIRGVRHGTNRASIKQVYIHPKLVAFKDYNDEPPMSKQYHVGK